MIVTISTSLQANILLDNNFHCQIADFGLARHSDITATRSTTALSFNFAAPELLGACIICNQSDEEGDCPGCGSNGTQRPKKTAETDVYGFGCFYYEVSTCFADQSRLILDRLDFFRPHTFQGNGRSSDNQVCYLWKASPSIARASSGRRCLGFNRVLLGDGSKEPCDDGRRFKHNGRHSTWEAV